MNPSALQPLLACPVCEQEPALQRGPDGFFCPACGYKIVEKDGVLEGAWSDVGYAEIKADAFETLLHKARAQGWRSAVEEMADEPGIQPRYLAKTTRADFQYLLPLSPQAVVLDIGAGMGTLAQALAARAGLYVALENDTARLRFTQIRLQQEGLTNTVCLHASALKAPLARHAFDLIVLNGVLEWLGLEGEEPAGVIQERALRRMAGWLKPGGTLYIGTDNRWALAQLRGAPEPHAMVPFVGCLPRSWADRLARAAYARGQGWARSPQLARGFRTWTYSLRGAHRLLRTVGLEPSGTWLPQPTYNQPHRILPTAEAPLSWYLKNWLSGKSAWKKALALCEALHLPTGWLSHLYRQTAGFFAFTAIKPGATPPRSLLEAIGDHVARESGEPPGHTYSGLLSGTQEQWPKTILLFPAGKAEPVAVAKISRSPITEARMRKEQANMQRFAALGLALKPPALVQIQDSLVSIRPSVSGRGLGALLNPRQPQKALPVLRATVEFLSQLNRQGNATGLDLAALRKHTEHMRPAIQQAAPDLLAAFEAAASKLLQQPALPSVPAHGDFVLSNLWMAQPNVLTPVDWEEADLHAWPLLDLTLFALDLAFKKKSLAAHAEVRALLDEQCAAFSKGWKLEDQTVQALIQLSVFHLLARLVERDADPETLEQIAAALRKQQPKAPRLEFS